MPVVCDGNFHVPLLHTQSIPRRRNKPVGRTLPEEEGGHPAAKQLGQRQTVLGSGAEQAGREGQRVVQEMSSSHL